MSLDQTTVRRIAALARLNIGPEQIDSVQQDLNRILSFIEQLSEVDTSSTEPMVGVELPSLPMREDIVNDGNKVKEILLNAPSTSCDMFVVPKVVE